jgi:DNA mismatch repair ATPase MutS
MLNQEDFNEKVTQLKEEIKRITDVDDHAVIEETASRLKGVNYAPPILGDRDFFLNCTSKELLDEIDRIIDTSESETISSEKEEHQRLQIKLQHVSVLVFYFKELADLRRGLPEAWDEIDELYIFD